MDWDAFARDLRDNWEKLDVPARKQRVLRWKQDSKRSVRELARILKKSESGLRTLFSAVEKKNGRRQVNEGAKPCRAASMLAKERGAVSTSPKPGNAVQPRSIAPVTNPDNSAPAKPAPVSTVVEQIIAWMERLQISDVDRRTVADDIRFQLNDNRGFVKRDIARFGVATLEVRPPDLGPGDLGDLSIWGPWVARFLWLHPQRDAIAIELKKRCQESYSLSAR